MSSLGRERKVAKARKPVTLALRYEVAMKVPGVALIIIGAAIAASSLPTVFRNEDGNVFTTARVRLAANLNRLEEVWVLLP